MNIALISKGKNHISLRVFDESLKELDKEDFADVYTLNFFLQTIPRRYNDNKTLIILNDKEKTSLPKGLETEAKGEEEEKKEERANDNIRLFLAKDENSFFIEE
ncbi:MAG: hypothetical protein M3162_09195 [Thermoproteota archaeon]|nr:hypothetical protein [Thermoproteota archaeon]